MELESAQKRFSDSQKFLFNLYLTISNVVEEEKGIFYIDTNCDCKFKPPTVLPYYEHYKVVKIQRDREKS